LHEKRVVFLLSLILVLSILTPMAFAKITAPTDPYAGYVDPYRPDIKIDVNGDQLTAQSKGNSLSLYEDSVWILDDVDALTYEPLGQESFFYEVGVSVSGDKKGSYVYNLDGKLTALDQVKRTEDTRDIVSVVYDENGKPARSGFYHEKKNGGIEVAFDQNGDLTYLFSWNVDDDGNLLSSEEYWINNGTWLMADPDEDLPVEVKGNIEKILSKYNAYVKAPHVYPHNTVCAAGLSLREENPQLTKKWYHVVPIDLTKDGETELPLVASNLFVIGKAIVSVHEGKVAVTYAYEKGRMREEGQLLNWFTSMDEITTDYLNAPEGKFEFGKEVDIATELNDAEVGYLLICNTISYSEAYRHNGDQLPSYNHGSAENTQAREALRELIK